MRVRTVSVTRKLSFVISCLRVYIQYIEKSSSKRGFDGGNKSHKMKELPDVTYLLLPKKQVTRPYSKKFHLVK